MSGAHAARRRHVPEGGEPTVRRPWWRPVLVLVLVAVVVLTLLRSCAPEGAVRVVAVGDMACDPLDPHYGDGLGRGRHCRARALSDLALDRSPDHLLGLGDYQYELPTSQGYGTAYADSWGRLRAVTIPARGNQEYKVHEANTFVDYFGELAGDPAGYWSTEVGAWRVIVLDSNCTTVFGGCAEGSPQQEWLAAELADHESGGGACTVALMHHPRWSSGIMGDDEGVADLWRTLAAGGAELVLSGHEADYERFAPIDADGKKAPEGLVQVVAGAGGQAHYRPQDGGAAWRRRQVVHTSEHVDYDHHGFLELELEDGSWSSAYHRMTSAGDEETAPTSEITDRAGGTCR